VTPTSSAPPAPAPAPLTRLWPGPRSAVTVPTLLAAGAAGVLAAFAVPDVTAGAGLVAAGALAASAVACQRGRAWTWPEVGLAALAGCLLLVAAARDAEELVALCVRRRPASAPCPSRTPAAGRRPC